MKKFAPQKGRPTAKKKSKPVKGYWHFDHIVANATEAKMNRIWDGFIVAVEKEGLYCTGTFHPAGGCEECRGTSDE